jgi:hypothetical protein
MIQVSRAANYFISDSSYKCYMMMGMINQQKLHKLHCENSFCQRITIPSVSGKALVDTVLHWTVLYETRSGSQ